MSVQRLPNRLSQWLGDRSLRTQLFTGIGIVLLVVSVANVLAFRVSEEESALQSSRASLLTLESQSTQAISLVSQARSNYLRYLLTGDEFFLERYTGYVAAYNTQFLEVIAQATDDTQASRWQVVFDLVERRRNEVDLPGIALRQQVSEGTASNQELASFTSPENVQEHQAPIQNAITEAQAYDQALLQQRESALNNLVWNTRLLLVLRIAILLAYGVGFAWYIGRNISGPVKQLADAASEIADGRFDRRIGWSRGDEIGRMAASFDRMAERVETLVQAQQQSLQAIQQQEAVLQAVMDSVEVGIAMVGVDGRVQVSNRAMFTAFGLRSNEFVGVRADELVRRVQHTFLEPARLLAEYERTIANPEITLTNHFVQTEPSSRQFEIHTAPVRSRSGERLGRIFAMRDVTREREIDRMKTEFVSMVSHELRTPLTSIKGYVDLLRDGEVGELNAEQTAFLEIVASSTDRLVALINDLLDISRIESGKIELKREQLDLAQCIEATATTFRPQLAARHQTLRLELPGAPLPILGDTDRITQILTNLLSNAHKYAPDGTEIRVVAAVRGGNVELRVIDRGIGLTPAEQAQLFTRFYRSQNQVVQEAGGTGLGLAITRSLVELHGGTIAVRSVPGEGATFSVTLPLANMAPAPAEPETAGQRRILVIEDEPDIAGLLRRYLRRAGHEVQIAATATDGLRQAKTLQPDLITLDVYLPDVDGFTLLDWLQADPATSTIPVILISVSPADIGGSPPGVAAHLTKPVHEAVLLDEIRRLLPRPAALTPPEPAPVSG